MTISFELIAAFWTKECTVVEMTITIKVLQDLNMHIEKPNSLPGLLALPV